MRIDARCWFVPLVLALSACALFSSEEEPTVRQLTVVDEQGAFDPTQAVDDDDDLERPLADARDAQAQDAFATPGADEPPAAEPDTGAPDPSPAEHVATPDEVAKLLAERQQDFEAAARQPDDDESKVDLAHNPAAEGVGAGPSLAWTLTDYLLEGGLLAVAAALISVCLLIARRHPKATLALALLVTAAGVGFVWSQLD